MAYENKYDIRQSNRDIVLNDDENDYALDDTYASKVYRCLTIDRGKWPGGRDVAPFLGNAIWQEGPFKKTKEGLEHIRQLLAESLEQLEKSGKIRVDTIEPAYINKTLYFVVVVFDFSRQRKVRLFLDSRLFNVI